MITLWQKAESLKFVEKIKEIKSLQPLPVGLEDIYQWVDQYSPAMARRLLTLALPWLRPFAQGRWFRVARLTDQEIEIVIPFLAANKDPKGGVHEAVMFGAAVEALTLFWWRHLQETPQILIRDVSLRTLKKAFGELRLKAQVSEKAREMALQTLRRNSTARLEIPLKAFDAHENLVAEIDIKLEISLTPQLSR